MPKSAKLATPDQVEEIPLLMITNLENLQVDILNFCSAFPELSPDVGKQDFLRSFVHPEDYPYLLSHLSACIPLPAQQISTCSLRLRNAAKTWSLCLIKSQKYAVGGPQSILSVVEKEKEESSLEWENSQDQYLNLVNSLDEGFALLEMVYDKNGEPEDYIYLQTNPAFEKQVRFKNVVGKRVSDLVEQPNKRWLKAFGEVDKLGKPVRFEEFNRNLNDSWLNLYAFPVGRAGSRRIGTLFRNVTAQKLAEIELKKAKAVLEKSDAQSTMLLQSVFESTNLGIAVLGIIFDDDGKAQDFKYLRVNPILRKMYQEKEPVGKTMLDFSKHSVQLGLFAALQKVAETGTSLDTELFFDKEGYKNWFRITAVPQDDIIVASLEDITKRKEESLQLEEIIRFKKQLVRTSPETIMIINLEGLKVRYINKDLLPEAGMTKNNIQGKPVAELLPYIHPRDREKAMEMHRKLLKSSENDILDLELRLNLSGTSWEWFSIRGKIFHRRNDGWLQEYMLLLRNITEQKEVQKALLKAEKFSIQGEVARTLAHELRNPLASMKMTHSILDKKLSQKGVTDLNNYLNILSRSTQTLNNLVTNLLNSSNYSPANLVELNLAEVVDKVLDKAADRIYLSGIRLNRNYKGSYKIQGDEDKLIIALLNIIVNASEAVKPEEGIIDISITEEKTDFRLDISDNGHGLDQGQVDRLFEAFYTNKNTGVGVGLSSVKNIIEEHDAQVKVKSRPGEGTTFSFFFNKMITS